MARPKLGESETERLHIKITADEIKAIDDWRYENRVPSRSEAVRRLVQIGIICTGTTTTAAEGLHEIYERCHALYHDIVKDFLAASEANDDAARKVLEPLRKSALTLFERVELAQLLTAEIGNQVAGIAGAQTFDEGFKKASDWRQKAAEHREVLRQEQAKRAK